MLTFISTCYIKNFNRKISPTYYTCLNNKEFEFLVFYTSIHVIFITIQKKNIFNIFLYFIYNISCISKLLHFAAKYKFPSNLK